ncbi:hypothetical protein VSPL_39950 [Vibrio splendidus]|nr:hypothetical protein VSPL_39950 [Vibrio splendidus]
MRLSGVLLLKAPIAIWKQWERMFRFSYGVYLFYFWGLYRNNLHLFLVEYFLALFSFWFVHVGMIQGFLIGNER